MPSGKGIAARGDLIGRVASYAKGMDCDFVWLFPNMLRSDAAQCKSAGLQVYVGSTPEQGWYPRDVERTTVQFEGLCAQYGLSGYYADIEWGNPARNGVPHTDTDIIRAANALKASAQRMGSKEVILTDFHADEVWRKAGPICGKDVKLSLQLYDTARTATAAQAILDTAKSLGWENPYDPFFACYKWEIIPGPNRVRKLTPQEFNAYAAKFPAVDSAIGWYPTPAPNGALYNAIRDWQPKRRGILPFLVSSPLVVLGALLLLLLTFVIISVLNIAR